MSDGDQKHTTVTVKLVLLPVSLQDVGHPFSYSSNSVLPSICISVLSMSRVVFSALSYHQYFLCVTSFPNPLSSHYVQEISTVAYSKYFHKGLFYADSFIDTALWNTPSCGDPTDNRTHTSTNDL